MGLRNIKQEHKMYPFIVEQIFLQGLSSLDMYTLVCNIWILLVATAFIILAAMGFPVCWQYNKSHEEQNKK